MALRADRVNGDGAWQRIRDARAVVSPDRVRDAGAGERDRIVVRNELDGAHVRVGAALWRLVERFDGSATIADHLAAENRMRCAHGLQAIRATADLEAIAHGITALERAGLVDCHRPEGPVLRLAHAREQARRRRRARWTNPLSVRLPLHDPDRWLDRWQPALARVPLRALLVGLVVLSLVSAGVALASLERLLADLAALAGAPRRWWSLLLVWPCMKAAHELAHALAVRRFGGRVHEVGIALLVLMPVPYVDASDASLFARRRERMLVSAAGMLAEGALAAFALLCWSVLEPGALRDAMLAIVVTGSVSTLLFNANPLLRFDGYYLLQDALEMPNLAARSAAWWRALARRRLFGIGSALDRAPRRERRWLAGYGLASLLYRYAVMVTIAWWLLETVPVLGVVLAGYALWPMLVQPVIRLSRWVATSHELTGRRWSATVPSASVLTVLVLAVTMVPLAASSRVTGVIRPAGSTAVTAPEHGELQALPGMRAVRGGEVIARLHAPAMLDERVRLEARVATLDAAIGAAFERDPLERRLLRGERHSLLARAHELQARIGALSVRAPVDGRFVPASATLLPGQHVERGTVLGHLVGDEELVVHAVLQEHQFARTRHGPSRAEVRLAEAPLQVHPARTVRESPAADHRLPSAVLAGDGAGGIAVAGGSERLQTVRPVFDVELALPAEVRVAGLGGRAYVTFHHPPEPLARRWWRGVRRLLLERLDV